MPSAEFQFTALCPEQPALSVAMDPELVNLLAAHMYYMPDSIIERYGYEEVDLSAIYAAESEYREKKNLPPYERFLPMESPEILSDIRFRIWATEACRAICRKGERDGITEQDELLLLKLAQATGGRITVQDGGESDGEIGVRFSEDAEPNEASPSVGKPEFIGDIGGE